MFRSKRTENTPELKLVDLRANRAQKLLGYLAMMPFLLAFLWVLFRISTFFLVPTLSDMRQTVNVPYSPWLVIISFYALFLFGGLVLQAGYLLATKDVVLAALTALVAVALLVAELVGYMIFGPDTSLRAWAELSNTWISKSIYTRVVTVAPVVETYQFRGKRYQSTNTLIENWNCGFPPIRRQGFSAPKNAESSYCIDVHAGLFGWDWIDKLRSCSIDDLARAKAAGRCTGNPEKDG